MSQVEVFNFLKVQRLCGQHKFWRKYEIQKELRRSGLVNGKCDSYSIGRMVNKLYAHGFLEIRQDPVKFMIQSYRIKEEYLKVGSPEDVSVWFKDS